MTTRDVFGNGKLLTVLISLSIILGGFISYKILPVIMPLKERLAVAEQKLENIYGNQNRLADEHNKFVTTKELIPMLESIQRQLNAHQEACNEFNKLFSRFERVVARLESRLPDDTRRP
jgi:exonuclease VII small subunit